MNNAAIVLGMAVPALYAQQAPRLSFDVASIRPHEGPLSRIADFSIFQVFVASEKLPMYDYYEIAALAPGPAVVTREESRQMLQSLLADRFKLQFHREMREIPVYQLVVDKNGQSLKPGSGDAACASRIGPVQPQDRNYQYQFTNCALDRLVNSLQADRPILDKTGLAGRYDITLSATPPFKMRDSSEPGDIELSDAIRQLGLRLQAQRTPIDVFVVDHVEKPADN